MAKEFTDAKFEEEVLKKSTPVLVDFWAPWCGPCRTMSPIIDELTSEYEGKCGIGKLNVDENPEQAQKHGIMSIPTIFIFKGGEVVEQIVGVKTKDELKTLIDKHL